MSTWTGDSLGLWVLVGLSSMSSEITYSFSVARLVSKILTKRSGGQLGKYAQILEILLFWPLGNGKLPFYGLRRGGAP